MVTKQCDAAYEGLLIGDVPELIDSENHFSWDQDTFGSFLHLETKR